jgi:ATP-dependent DNA ligase
MSDTPMLARLVRELPVGDFVYEPKWDGFRCLAARRGDDVDLRSRNGRPFARYFPELVAALRAVREPSFVVDGEVLAQGASGEFDFAALLARLHPAATRARRLSVETPATFIAFDLLEQGSTDLRDAPFRTRRAALEALLAGAPPRLRLTPATRDPDMARRWLDATGAIDGVVAKHVGLRYQGGKRAMVKVKRERTLDCAVPGIRVFEDGRVASLLLALFDGDEPVHVGVASSFSHAKGRALAQELCPLVTTLHGHPWARGFGRQRAAGRLPGAASHWSPDMPLDWVPLRIERVAEVVYDHLDDGLLRHPARLERWRPDRVPASCTFAQLEGGGA